MHNRKHEHDPEDDGKPIPEPDSKPAPEPEPKRSEADQPPDPPTGGHS